MTLFEVQENNYSAETMIEGVQRVHLHPLKFSNGCSANVVPRAVGRSQILVGIDDNTP